MTIILALFGCALVVWLMFKLATLALPFAVGIWSAFWLLHHDYGILISIVGGFALAICVLVAGQILFAAVRSPRHSACTRCRICPARRGRRLQSGL